MIVDDIIVLLDALLCCATNYITTALHSLCIEVWKMKSEKKLLISENLIYLSKFNYD